MIKSWILANILLFLLLTLLWVVSRKKKDVSIVDPAWSIGIIFQPIVIFLFQTEKTLFQLLVLVLAGIWALRLSGYLIYRNWGKGEDKRYAEMRLSDPHFDQTSLFKIFWFQGLLMTLVALPLNLMMGWGIFFHFWSLIPLVVAITGLIWEVVADMQLVEFKQDPKNKGLILDTGLWGLSRHPNYFGEFVFWWGIFGVSLPLFWYVTWVSPVLVSFLLLKVSGVTLLDRHLRDKKGFSEYESKIPPFFPTLFPKR